MISVTEMQKWLENHCHENANVVGGMVTLTNFRDDSHVVAAQWPKQVGEDGRLFAAASSRRIRTALPGASRRRPRTGSAPHAGGRF